MTKTVEDIIDDGNEAWTGEEIRRRLREGGYLIVPLQATPNMRIAGAKSAFLKWSSPVSAYETDMAAAWNAMVKSWEHEPDDKHDLGDQPFGVGYGR